jgi:hypothetical protein
MDPTKGRQTTERGRGAAKVTTPTPKVSNPNPWPPSKILATFEDGQGFIEGGQTTEVDTFGILPTMMQHQQMKGESNDRSYTVGQNDRDRHARRLR